MNNTEKQVSYVWQKFHKFAFGKKNAASWTLSKLFWQMFWSVQQVKASENFSNIPI